MWKLIIGEPEVKKIKNNRTKGERKASIYTIITNNDYSLVVGKWEELSKDCLKDDIKLEINGRFFKQHGDSSYSRDFVHALGYIKEDNTICPKKDIKTLKDAKALYEYEFNLAKKRYSNFISNGEKKTGKLGDK